MKKEQEILIDYFEIEGTPGGNQEWCTNFWMYVGGCAALAACDLSICLSKNYALRECYPYEPKNMTKKEYVDFSMIMKPYISPRMGGVDKVSIFTEGYGKYLRSRGYEAEFEECSGECSFEEADDFMRRALKKNLPVPFLLLRHRDKNFKDLNWHWFMITGYIVKNGRITLKYHTYGEEQEVDFYNLWDTGMYRRGGMTAIKNIKKYEK
ncbi:MAG: hypothetical protein LUF92_08125 [Clostridiales bacterium]|nr:hypothetical protein [Clostridiales bacterium]